MKICIFSDIHGNLDAFNKMLEAEEDADCLIFAGDIFGYFYGQKQIIDQLLCKKNLLAVKGNHDNIFLQSERQAQELIDRYGSSYCTILSEKQKAYIESLPNHLEAELDGKRFGIFHGGIEDHLNQRIYPDSSIRAEWIDGKYDYLILGHTHYKLFRSVGSTTIINPGSLGQPRDGTEFSYCVLNTDDNSCEFMSVKISIKNLLDEVKKNDPTRKVCKYLHDKYGGQK